MTAGTFVIISIIIIISLMTASAISVRQLQGEWLYALPGGIDAYKMAVSIDKKNGMLTAVGKFPNNKGFLVRGSTPFLYQLNMYPLLSQTPAYRIEFIPIKKTIDGAPAYKLVMTDLQTNESFEYIREPLA